MYVDLGLLKGGHLNAMRFRNLFSHVKVIQAPKGFGMQAILGCSSGVNCAAREIVALDMGSMIYKDRALKVLGKGAARENGVCATVAHGKELDTKWVEEVPRNA